MGRKRNTDTNGAAHRRLKRWLFCMAALILIPAAVVAAYVLSRDAWHMLDEEKLSYEKLSATRVTSPGAPPFGMLRSSGRVRLRRRTDAWQENTTPLWP